MGRFSTSAKSTARNSSGNPTAHYIDHESDWGEGIFLGVSIPYVETKKGKQIVPQAFRCLLWESDDRATKEPRLASGATRNGYLDLQDTSTRGQINAQEFKSLMTSMARVPLADELAVEAIARLVALGVSHPQGYSAELPVDLLPGFRDKMIEDLMEKWTDGEGTMCAGRPFGLAVYGKASKEGKPANGKAKDGLWTNKKFSILGEEELSLLQTIKDLPVAERVELLQTELNMHEERAKVAAPMFDDLVLD